MGYADEVHKDGHATEFEQIEWVLQVGQPYDERQGSGNKF